MHLIRRQTSEPLTQPRINVGEIVTDAFKSLIEFCTEVVSFKASIKLYFPSELLQLNKCQMHLQVSLCMSETFLLLFLYVPI